MKRCKECLIRVSQWQCEICEYFFCEKCLKSDQKGFSVKLYCEKCNEIKETEKKRNISASKIQEFWKKKDYVLL